jgi:hypothetical protein
MNLPGLTPLSPPSKRHLARRFPRFSGDRLGLGMERSDLRLQFLPPGGDDPVDHGFVLLRFPVDLFLNPHHSSDSLA